jgi:hypothetical protein
VTLLTLDTHENSDVPSVSGIFGTVRNAHKEKRRREADGGTDRSHQDSEPDLVRETGHGGRRQGNTEADQRLPDDAI